MNNNPHFNILNHFNRFGKHGNGVVIKGRTRSGKTTLVSLFTKQLLDNGFAVITNVRFTDAVLQKYPNLYYITSDYEFFESYIEIQIDIPIVLIWDDAQASEGMKSTQVTTKKGDYLGKFLIFIGKFESNFIYIAHQKYIPSVITDGVNPLMIYKLQRNSFYVGDELYESDYEIRQHCYYVPLPDIKKFALPILSKTPAYFDWVVDLNGLYKYLSKYAVNDDLKTATKEFLNQNQSDNGDESLKKLTWEQITKAIYYKRNGKLSGKEKLYQVINTRVLYSVLDEFKKS